MPVEDQVLLTRGGRGTPVSDLFPIPFPRPGLGIGSGDEDATAGRRGCGVPLAAANLS